MGVIATVSNISIYQNLAAWVIETIQKHLFLDWLKDRPKRMRNRPVLIGILG